jgi:hypothetical protein
MKVTSRNSSGAPGSRTLRVGRMPEPWRKQVVALFRRILQLLTTKQGVPQGLLATKQGLHQGLLAVKQGLQLKLLPAKHGVPQPNQPTHTQQSLQSLPI